MFNFPKSLIGSPPGQEDQSARLAASAEVGQVEDASLGVDFHTGNGLVTPFFASSLAFFRGDSREWMKSLIDFSPHLAPRGFYAVAPLSTHAMGTVGWPYVNGGTSFARFVAVCASAAVDGLSGCTGSGADEYGQQRSLQHCEFPLFEEGSFA